ncbi:hypothetical protein H6781_01940 [Candidatus Nomurabacteria bacterium]|nr:hypothetical protein [Candidatus Nomurabacteria bacterium]
MDYNKFWRLSVALIIGFYAGLIIDAVPLWGSFLFLAGVLLLLSPMFLAALKGRQERLSKN